MEAQCETWALSSTKPLLKAKEILRSLLWLSYWITCDIVAALVLSFPLPFYSSRQALDKVSSRFYSEIQRRHAVVKVHQLALNFAAAVCDYFQQFGFPDWDLQKIADNGLDICVTATFLQRWHKKMRHDFVLTEQQWLDQLKCAKTPRWSPHFPCLLHLWRCLGTGQFLVIGKQLARPSTVDGYYLSYSDASPTKKDLSVPQ